MKQLLLLLTLVTSIIASAQTKIPPVPKDGMESFVKELTDNIIFPESYYENEGLTLRISVDSVSNVKLVTLKPYNAEFYKELKLFVESTEWISGTIDNIPKTQVISLEVKLNNRAEKITQKASPKNGIADFYSGMAKAIRSESISSSNIKYELKFVVTKTSEVKDIKVTPSNFDLEADLKLYLRKTQWNPAYHNGEAVNSTITFPIKSFR